MIDIFSTSAKLGFYVPKFHWRFKYYILHVAGSYFSCGLVFNMQKMSIVLNLDNSISGSPLEVPFAGLLVLEIYPISYFKRGWHPIHGLLCSSHPTSSWQWPMQVCVLQESVFQNLSLPRIVAWAVVADAEVNLDPFNRLKKWGFCCG